MPAPTTPLIPSKDAQKSLIQMVNSYLDDDNGLKNLHATFEARDREYAREMDRTTEQLRAQAANATGDVKKLQNPTVPVVAPQVETALAYFVETFCSSYPVFPVVAKPQLQGAALQIETVLGESAVHFRWVPELAKAMRDGLKYNLMAVEVEWEKDKVYAVENRPGESITLGVPTETVFEGNKLKRVDPYNLVLDRRVPPAEVHVKGDYAGYNELLTRLQLKQRLGTLDNSMTMNAKEAFESSLGRGIGSYNVPEITSLATAATASGLGTTNWMRWADLENGKSIQYKDMYELLTIYVRVIPREVGLSGSKAGTPQIYKLLIVNRSVIVYCERKTNAHNFLPIVVGQIIDDGLGYQTKSLAESSAPYQQIATGLWASAISSQRRKVYDRIFYNPQMVNKKDIDNTDPVARIPIKTEAYGRPIQEAVYALPYRDDTVPVVLSMAQQVTEMANISFGQNRVSQGQFQKGNKTRFEVNEVMTAADSRPRMYAVLLEASWFQPIKHILKSNILQYQPPADLYNRGSKEFVRIAPEELRKTTWEFKVADGVMPVDKLVNMEALGLAMQLAMSQPQIAQEYDVLGIFFYQMQLQGASWIADFKRQPQQGVSTNANPAQPDPTASGVPPAGAITLDGATG